jgi:hypothetical protein
MNDQEACCFEYSSRGRRQRRGHPSTSTTPIAATARKILIERMTGIRPPAQKASLVAAMLGVKTVVDASQSLRTRFDPLQPSNLHPNIVCGRATSVKRTKSAAARVRQFRPAQREWRRRAADDRVRNRAWCNDVAAARRDGLRQQSAKRGLSIRYQPHPRRRQVRDAAQPTTMRNITSSKTVAVQ